MDLNVSLLIRLIDQVTAPARKLRDNLRGTLGEMRAGFADAIKQGLSVENVESSIKQAETQLGQARGRMLGAIGQGLALAAPVLNMGKFESQLVGFGNTAGIFGDDLKAIEAQLRATGPEVNKSASELLTGLEYLVGKGLSPDAGMTAIRSVGLTATATGASIEDMAASGFSALDNLKVPAEQLQLAFDAMAQSGKSGGFELRDMAQYFPKLSASAQALGMEGVPAVAELGAALQIAMKGAGDPSEAANNMQNFLSKLSSPETVKRFAELGINVQDEFKKASDSGVSVFEHMLDVINKASGGDQFKMGELFGDQQVLNFLRPMLANLGEFKSIRDEALSADGINADDFARVVATFTEQLKAAAVQIDNLVSNSGVLLSTGKDLVAQFTAGVAAVNAFAQANPELTRTIIMVAAGLMALSIATKVAAFGFWSVILPARQLVGFFLKFSETGKNVATGWRLIAGAGSLLSGAFNLIVAAAGAVGAGLGAITAPVWAVIGVLVAAGFALWKYWDRISSFVSGMAEAYLGAVSAVIQAIGGAIDGLITKIAELLGFDQGQIEAFKTGIADGFAAAFGAIGGIIDGAKEVMAGFWSWLTEFFSQEKLSDEEKAAMKAAGAKLINDMLTGIQEAFQAVLDWFSGIGARIAEAIGSIDIGSFITWPEPPDWLSWMFGGGEPPKSPPPPPDGPPPAAPGSMAAFRGALGVPAEIDPSSWAELQGGAAPDVQQTINAEVVDKRPPQQHITVHAPISITGVSDGNAAGNAAARGLAHEIAQAKQGALHDGVD